ncbi:MAG: DUF3574 domain-containing protein [Ruminococcaceae bacterium]|nr:DUF3574 domain-containing protein [Oscillospiraceae bacterium]
MDGQTIQTTIYVGLNDAETGVQKFDTAKYVSILKNVCYNFGVAFSVHRIEGGYFHENGTYVEETTLALLLMDTPEDKVIEIAKDLCAFFHQESVMVTSSPCSVVFVKEDVWDKE